MGPLMEKLKQNKLMRQLIGKPFFLISKVIWKCTPEYLRRTSLMVKYGKLLHGLVKERFARNQSLATYFLRNPSEMELFCKLAGKKPLGSPLKVVFLGSSTGAEAYSFTWKLKSHRSDLKLSVTGIEIDDSAVNQAREGKYDASSEEFMLVQPEDFDSLFTRIGDYYQILPDIQKDIQWRQGDARDPDLPTQQGHHDFVFANRFLCHMPSAEAEATLRSISKLVAPGGYLFVSGVDLDIREKVATDSEWAAVEELLEEIHNGDVTLHNGWPWNYWGLEPMDKNLSNWKSRYAAVFQCGPGTMAEQKSA